MMEDYCVMVTASNDGFIKMWKLQLKEVRLVPGSHYKLLSGDLGGYTLRLDGNGSVHTTRFSLSSGASDCAASHPQQKYRKK